MQNYWENAIDGNTVLIKFLNIFCYGKFHIYFAKSPLGSENKTYASWVASYLKNKTFKILLVDSAKLDISFVKSFAVPTQLYLDLCIMLIVAFTIFNPLFKFMNDFFIVYLSP